MEKYKEFDTYSWLRFDNPLNTPGWIDVIWLECKLLQNIKQVLNTMTTWDPISIRKVGRQHLCTQSQHTETQRSKGEGTHGTQWSTLEN
jgi:hypothetical protein